MFRDYSYPDVVVPRNYVYTPIIGTAPASYTVPAVAMIRRGSYSGTLTKGYHHKLATGEMLPLQPYERFTFQENRDNGGYVGLYSKTTSPVTIYRYSVNLNRMMSSEICSSLVSAENAVTKMVEGCNILALQQEAVAECAGKMDALTTLVELPQTIRMILNARRTAKKLISDALKGGHKTAKAASEAWLEWRYGWRLLIEDLKTIAEIAGNPKHDLIVTGRSGKSYTAQLVYPYHFVGYHAQYDFDTVIQRDLSVRVHAQALLKATMPFGVSFSPLVTAYELIPFSFVADWFVTVGSYLSSIDVWLRAERVETSIGYKFTESASADVKNVSVGSGLYASEPQAWGRSTSTTELRLRVPLGGYVPSFPTINVELTGKRILDAIALLLTRIF